ncbi:two-component sensor histidine kinase [Streptosporangiaceae bacterium NEAU-GS5]|nr:two-component sensor histidine kinase [Streptosporangiaceae bacterium NEAU-GS5]
MIGSYAAVNMVRFVALGEPHSPALVALGLVMMATILLMQVFHFGYAERRNGPGRLRWLIAQALLVYGPLPWLGEGWLGMPSFLAASCLLVLPPAWAWSLASAIVVGDVAQDAVVSGFTVFSVIYTFSAAVITTLVVYGLIWLSELVTEVDRSRAALARMAVEKERLRFARDLHDLLGYSLSTVILKIELTQRLGKANWARASEELGDVLRITRQALADVRMVSSGYRQMSLQTELESVGGILTVAGIESDTHVGIDISELSQQASTLLSTVLREGVTNMLRHSDAQRFEILIDRSGEESEIVEMRMINDGLRGHLSEDCVGSGISNLTMRVEASGGRLTAEVRDGRFHLLTEVPESCPEPAKATDETALSSTLHRWWARRGKSLSA